MIYCCYFSGFIEILARVSIAIFSASFERRDHEIDTFDASNIALIRVCVNSLLRLMDESDGKEKLIKCLRKSVNIRKFVVK